ncbi:uncharacterized protein LOC101738910 [Bombyx mori]|uniref:Uncharacterized protein n=1 Tax=Bombyx mori TaxID=7091 RepID=A0A8R2ARK8_BOMMO|nr:uncharacterized protein LOC101738910 [Bombyx mori]
MTDKNLIAKLASVPLEKPGFDALNMTAPFMVQMNPDGKWNSCKPENLDEERLKAVVQYLVKSKAVAAAHSYCTQCTSGNQKNDSKSNYVPVIMMPIYPADQCPFDMDCEIKKMKDSEIKTVKKAKKLKEVKDSEKNNESKKTKKHGFVLQRLTDFDLLSQW